MAPPDDKPGDSIRTQVGAFAMVPVWVLERCSSPAVHAYAFLMKHANRHRRAWPRTDLLAEAMGKSLRSIERAIAELRREGALVTKRRHGRNGAVLGLEFILVQMDPREDHPATNGGMDDSAVARPVSRRNPAKTGLFSAVSEADQATPNHPANSGGMADPVENSVHSATDGGKDGSHPAIGVGTFPPPVAVYKNELDPENQIQELEERALPQPERGNVFTGDDGRTPTDPCELFRLAWNESTHPPIPACQSLTASRRKLIRAALAWRDLDAWRAIFARVNASTFCRGSKGWVMTFDWLVKVDHAQKVIEGHYDDHISPGELIEAKSHLFRTRGYVCPHEPPCTETSSCPAVRDFALALRKKLAS